MLEENFEKKTVSTRGGVRPGAGRPCKEQKNAKRQISLPYELDSRLKALAKKENVSFSSLIVQLVQKGLDAS